MAFVALSAASNIVFGPIVDPISLYSAFAAANRGETVVDPSDSYGKPSNDRVDAHLWLRDDIDVIAYDFGCEDEARTAFGGTRQDQFVGVMSCEAVVPDQQGHQLAAWVLIGAALGANCSPVSVAVPERLSSSTVRAFAAVPLTGIADKCAGIVTAPQGTMVSATDATVARNLRSALTQGLDKPGDAFVSCACGSANDCRVFRYL